MVQNIIGITGAKYTGKTTLAREIVRQHGNAQIYSFAKPLKEVCHILFGGTEANWYGDFKNEKLPEWSLLLGEGFSTPRRILQTVGADLFRDKVYHDFWVLVARRYIADIFQNEQCGLVVIDDVRFDNEAEMLRNEDYNTTIVKITRDTDAPKDSHASERGVTGHLIDYRYEIPRKDQVEAVAHDILKRAIA